MQVGHRLWRLDARLLEGIGVVPDRRFVRGLEENAVELPVDRPEVLPYGGIVLANQAGRVAVKLL